MLCLQARVAASTQAYNPLDLATLMSAVAAFSDRMLAHAVPTQPTPLAASPSHAPSQTPGLAPGAHNKAVRTHLQQQQQQQQQWGTGWSPGARLALPAPSLSSHSPGGWPHPATDHLPNLGDVALMTTSFLVSSLPW